MKFTKIPENTFKEMQLNAGILMKTFDPETATVTPSEILSATTGGISFSAVPTYKDMGEDIDNCPKNMKELKEIETWDVKMSGTMISVTPALVKKLLGAADVLAEKITPRSDLTDADFEDVWWIGDYSDSNGEDDGGFVAIHMMNALSTAGFSLQSGDKSKGQMAFEYTAHYSIKAQTTVPFEVYVKAGGAAKAAVVTEENI